MEKTVFEMYGEMETIWKEFSENHTKFAEKGTKAAAARARKLINEFRKYVTGYRKASVKQIKSN